MDSFGLKVTSDFVLLPSFSSLLFCLQSHTEAKTHKVRNEDQSKTW